LLLKISKQDCATARAKLPPVDPRLSLAQSRIAGRLNTFWRTELKKQVLPWLTSPLGQLTDTPRLTSSGVNDEQLPLQKRRQSFADSLELSLGVELSPAVMDLSLVGEVALCCAKQVLNEATHFASSFTALELFVSSSFERLAAQDRHESSPLRRDMNT
jgi:hypothetical protein